MRRVDNTDSGFFRLSPKAGKLIEDRTEKVWERWPEITGLTSKATLRRFSYTYQPAKKKK